MVCHLVQLFETPWPVSYQIPPSIGGGFLSSQEYWSGLPSPPPGDLPDPGTEHVSLTSSALTGGFFTTRTTWAGMKSILGRGKNPCIIPYTFSDP